MKFNDSLTRSLGIVLAVLAGVLIWRRWRQNNDLTRHLDVEASLQDNGNIVGHADNAALDAYPLSTIGDSPYAGIFGDPFNPYSPAIEPHNLDWLNPIPASSRPENQPWFLN